MEQTCYVCKVDGPDCIEQTVHQHEIAYGYGYYDSEYGLSPNPNRGHDETQPPISAAWEWSYAQGYNATDYDPEGVLQCDTSLRWLPSASQK